MIETIYIYVIKDPRTNLVRYVGKAKDCKERFRKHLTENNGTLKSKWIKGLRLKGLTPVFEIIDECSAAEWEARERGYIRLFKSLGATLLNMMPGGEGGPTMKGRKLTDEQRAKITASKIGRPNKGAALSNKENKGIKIDQYDLNGNYIATYSSIREAAIAIGRDCRRIQAMVTGKPMGNKTVNHVGGFKFKPAS
jgi:hypothetical protein